MLRSCCIGTCIGHCACPAPWRGETVTGTGVTDRRVLRAGPGVIDRGVTLTCGAGDNDLSKATCDEVCISNCRLESL